MKTETMTAEQFAALLDGREVGHEITREEEAIAKASGLLVIFGYSDDNVELRGIFNDEIGAYGGGTVLIHRHGVIESERQHSCDCNYCDHKRLVSVCERLEAKWNDQGNPCWEYKTSLHHATFTIREEGTDFCRGIVIPAHVLPGIKSDTQPEQHDA